MKVIFKSIRDDKEEEKYASGQRWEFNYATAAIGEEDLQEICRVCRREWFHREPNQYILYVLPEYEEQVDFMLRVSFKDKEYTMAPLD